MFFSKIKERFPILKKTIYGKPLVYLDNASTTQKPQVVIDAITHYYTTMNSNIHRSSHNLANTTTQAIEGVRTKLQRFINASTSKEIIFTSGTTSSLNLVASTYGTIYLQPQDEILVSSLEHHSNLLPWQQVAIAKGALIKQIPITSTGHVNIKKLVNSLSYRTKIVAITHASNLLGTVTPLKKIIALAHKYGAIVIVDAAQTIGHYSINVKELNCDFLAFSSHKMYGPTGLGVLYGKKNLLEAMPPYQLGGGMAQNVSFTSALYQDIPYRFEAGTPHIAGILGLGAAIDFLKEVTLKRVKAHEENLLSYAHEQLKKLSYVTLLPSSSPKIGIISFIVKNIHHLDVGTYLNTSGIAVRTGHHCASPLIQHLDLPYEGTVRISLAMYNTKRDIDILVEALDNLHKKLRGSSR